VNHGDGYRSAENARDGMVWWSSALIGGSKRSGAPAVC
jgi:hypothetical protein